MKLVFLSILVCVVTGCSSQELVKPDSLVGHWMLKNSVVISGMTLQTPYVDIAPNMKVSGFTGCNLFKGKVETAVDDFDLPVVTRKVCLPQLIKQEEDMLNVLRSATKIKVMGNNMIVDAGDQYLVFQKKMSTNLSSAEYKKDLM